MKTIVLVASCVCAVVSRPQVGPATPIPILSDQRIPIDHLGGYGFRIETGNGINWQEAGAAIGPLSATSKSGLYSFTHPDGTHHVLSYTAGVDGFQPISSMLPTPHPLLPWQIEQIRFAESQRASAAVAATIAGP